MSPNYDGTSTTDYTAFDWSPSTYETVYFTMNIPKKDPNWDKAENNLPAIAKNDPGWDRQNNKIY